MSRFARMYIGSVFVAALGLFGAAVIGMANSSANWMILLVMTALATIAQLYEAGDGRQTYFPHLIFFFAGVLLLDAVELAPLVLMPHLVESLWKKASGQGRTRAWYVQPFNIAMHFLAGVIAKQLVVVGFMAISGLAFLPPVLIISVAAFVYVLINHVLVGLALQLARGLSFRESGILGYDSMLPDVVMVLLGAIIAVLWAINPWWLALALSPLLLMYQALHVPHLKQQAQIDGKTGLFNARHFNAMFAEALERAHKQQHNLTCIMADLDYLRNINNTYGHLAGDAVLEGIGKVIRATIRSSDIAGRFGGEEFSVVLPDTDIESARLLAERIRQAVEAAPFDIPGQEAPIHITMSLGVACFPQDATTQMDLVAAADVAVYQAKHQGRNRVICLGDVLVEALQDAGAEKPTPIDRTPALRTKAVSRVERRQQPRYCAIS